MHDGPKLEMEELKDGVYGVAYPCYLLPAYNKLYLVDRDYFVPGLLNFLILCLSGES